MADQLATTADAQALLPADSAAALLAALPDAVLLLDASGGCRYANAAAAALFGPGPLPATALAWLPRDADQWTRRWRRPDGARRMLSGQRLAAPLADGVTALLVRDITVVSCQERQAAALATIAAALNVEQSMTATLHALAENVVAVTDAGACAVILTDPDAPHSRMLGAAGIPADLMARTMAIAEDPANLALRAQVLTSHEPRVIERLHEYVLTQPAGSRLRVFAEGSRWETIVIVPLVARGQTLGHVNGYYPPEETPDADEIALLVAIAGQAAVAIENGRLARALEAKAVLEERTRLARDLHDSVTQSVFSLGLLARAAQTQYAQQSPAAGATLGRIGALSQVALAEMRALLYELRPSALEQEGLAGALEKLIAAFQVRTELTVSYSASMTRRLAPDVETALFRIVQESLSNAAKHARASHLAVALREEDSRLVVEVADDGRGFDAALLDAPARPGADGSGLGLRSMRERAALAGLDLTLISAPNAGTTVRVAARLGE